MDTITNIILYYVVKEDVMIKIKDEASSDPEMVKTAPHTTVVRRLDAVRAARELILKYSSD